MLTTPGAFLNPPGLSRKKVETGLLANTPGETS
jgi:hypothetical protein